ncbi:unnamed protein product, partial [Parnassius apollo]
RARVTLPVLLMRRDAPGIAGDSDARPRHSDASVRAMWGSARTAWASLLLCCVAAVAAQDDVQIG